MEFLACHVLETLKSARMRLQAACTIRDVIEEPTEMAELDSVTWATAFWCGKCFIVGRR